MLNAIKTLLLRIIDDIDTGNSNISEEDQIKLVEYLAEVSNKNEKLSKYQACNYLNVSRATFDNYVKEGKVPRGRKQQGFKEIFWFKKDLDKFKNKD